MPIPTLLSEKDIQDKLDDWPLWKRHDNSIVRELVGVNFAEAVGKVNAIAILAEAADHHPDILIYGWNKIRVTLSTHDAGGLSDKDFELAAKIEEIAY
jgi:4a-hydroxytetrahydrobiopterin dehydratase